jgi:lipoate-protein ligase B
LTIRPAWKTLRIPMLGWRSPTSVSSTAHPQSLLDVRRLGRTNYADAYRLQQELVALRAEGAIPDTLVLTEHEPVITLGRGAKREDVAGVGLPIFEIERGGEATWHGPGQVVAYPIRLLPEDRRDLHRYLRDLEEVVLRVLAEFQVEGRREPGKTGVWIGDKKVCSIGVAVRRWVTFHGLALNVHNDPAAFLGFNPCGLDPQVMTRLADHADLPPATILIEVLLIRHFLDVFGLELPPAAPREGSDPRFPDLPILG